MDWLHIDSAPSGIVLNLWIQHTNWLNGWEMPYCYKKNGKWIDLPEDYIATHYRIPQPPKEI